MAKRPLPVIIVDEHVAPAIIKSVENIGWFRVQRPCLGRRFHGRDEWDYLPEPRSLNYVFLTLDGAFVRRVVAERVRHAGIVWMQGSWPVSELAAAVNIARGEVRWHLDNYGVHGMRDLVIRMEQDGVRLIEDGREWLAASMP